MRYIIFFIVLVLLFNCKSDKDQHPQLSKKVHQFTEVYISYLHIIAADTAHVSEREKYMNQALLQHNMTKEQFNLTFLYLKQHPDEISNVLTDIQAKLTKIEVAEIKQ